MSDVLKLLTLSGLFAWLVGCASAPKTPDHAAEEYHSSDLRISRVALVTDLAPPEIDMVDLGFTKGEGAGVGALAGALKGAGLIGEMPCSSDSACYMLYTLKLAMFPVFMTGGAIVGGIVGTYKGEYADTLMTSEAKARTMLNPTYLQTELCEIVMSYGEQAYGKQGTELEFIRISSPLVIDLKNNKRDYTPLLSKSIDAVLEVDLLRVSLRASRLMESALSMEAEARLTSVHTGDVLSESHYRFTGESRRLDEWMIDDATPLSEEIQRGLATLAEEAIGENFLLFVPDNLECPTNITDHAKWFCSQADNGIADAQRRIGDILYCGQTKNARAMATTDMNLARAYVWYNLAASGNNTMALARLLTTQKELSNDQLIEAQKRLDVWKSRQDQCMNDLTEAGLIE